MVGEVKSDAGLGWVLTSMLQNSERAAPHCTAFLHIHDASPDSYGVPSSRSAPRARE